ncbi:Pyridoxamine 5'-phosphate oxidase [Gracilimonas mengyeensis]|uniref:Pyridoxamine 5'-phosphate oxidase n=2 Tax=Gracilimonas mengyeensis TaxID=1302730 RepID=A0A521DGZ9_9BACT|nr:Pyridoxamine 5'-phosphate oxidase [Gracilimonas mengyeensis]
MNLDAAWKKVLQQVQTANEDPGHSFRYMDLATVDAENQPVQRTVVLRDFDGKKTFSIFTDARSRKVKHIQGNDQVSLLFYDDDTKLQLSVQGKATLLTNGEKWERYWKEAGSKSPHSYTSAKAPGAIIDEPEDAYEWLQEENKHFCVVRIQAYKMTFLQLDGKRHLRGVQEFVEGQTNSRWIAP